MNLVFDLAAALNLAWSVLPSYGSSIVREWALDKRFRRDFVERLADEAHRGGFRIDKRELRHIDDEIFVRWVGAPDIAPQGGKEETAAVNAVLAAFGGLEGPVAVEIVANALVKAFRGAALARANAAERLIVATVERVEDKLDRAQTPASARAIRFDVPPLPRMMVPRRAKLDEVVGALLRHARVSVTSLKGAGGVGKTVLAQQAGHDERIRTAYPGGVWWLEVGEHPEVGAAGRTTLSEVVRRPTASRGDLHRRPAGRRDRRPVHLVDAR